MSQLKSLFLSKPLPRFARIEQKLDDTHIEDVRAETSGRLLAAGLRRCVQSGARIGVTAGSRGIGGFVELLNGVCDAVKSCGGKPFILPAMGSHGGATAEGQKRLLNQSGITAKSVPAPIRATMDTVPLGKSKTGAIAHLDMIASEADGIIVLGRVKTHPENKDGVASGLLKMTTVGLGKQVGAQQAHSHGLWPSVEAVPEVTLAKAKILFGVAVVENAFRKPVAIEVVQGNYDAFMEADRRLLDVAKKHFARIPFEQLDVLVVDQLGKNISGTGMDLNVIGKWRLEGGEHQPDFRRIAVLSLTPESCGNGLGIGLADFTTKRFMRDFDFEATYVNLITATEPGALNTREGSPPFALSSDRDAIAMSLESSLARTAPRICRIKNTGLLDEFWVSEAMMEEVETNAALTIVERPKSINFDEDGNLF
jgi:hypothetical protein